MLSDTMPSVGPLIPLNKPCGNNGICEDPNAECRLDSRGKICLCKPTHYENNGICGKCQNVYNLFSFCNCYPNNRRESPISHILYKVLS